MTQTPQPPAGPDAVLPPSGAGEPPWDAVLVQGLMDGSLGFSALCSADGAMILVDSAALEQGGVVLADVTGRSLWDGPWWAHDVEVQGWMRAACGAAAQGETSRREIRASLRDGSPLWIDLQVAPIADQQGAIGHIVVSGSSIRELRERQSRIAMLMGEVNHRTKNLLAIVQSIARQIAAHAPPEEAAKEIARRIGCLSATQDLIIRSGWVKVDLAALAHAQLEEHGDLPPDLVSMNSAPIAISPQAAQTIGLALFELGCGGAQRLSESDDPRHFTLDWGVEQDRFHLRWIEFDGEMAARPPLGSFSRLVLDQMTAAALNGRSEWDSADLQRSWTLNCPVAKIIVSD